MAQILTNVIEGYHDLMDNKSGKCEVFSPIWGIYDQILDPRVNDWFLMSSPFPTMCICLTYAYTVKVIGPRLMENRKPFDLKYTLILYNLFQVIFSTYLFYEVSYQIG
jgi:elongation of very long chain fatty acids protein 7